MGIFKKALIISIIFSSDNSFIQNGLKIVQDHGQRLTKHDGRTHSKKKNNPTKKREHDPLYENK